MVQARVNLPLKLLIGGEHILITSSTLATSMRRLPTVEVATAPIGRLLRTMTTVRTIWACIVPACTQVPIAAVRATATVLGV